MAQYTAGTWYVDPTHTEIGFTVRHLMSKVRGKFEKFDAQIVTAENPADSRATAEIHLDSINTGTPDRDNHLRSGDFFSIEDHPVMTFTATGVRENGDDSYVATGDLTIKDVSKPIELNVEFLGEGGDPWGGTRIGVEGTTEISRKEFGIDFNIPLDGGKLMIGDKVSVNIAGEFVLQS